MNLINLPTLIGLLLLVNLAQLAAQQDNLNKRITLYPLGTDASLQGYVHEVQGDTLWLASVYGPLNGPTPINAYAASQIGSLRLPVERRMKGNFWLGVLGGTVAGGVIGYATARSCRNISNLTESIACEAARSSTIGVSVVLGAVGGGLIGGMIRTNKRDRDGVHTFGINGEPRLFRAQRERLEQLIRRE